MPVEVLGDYLLEDELGRGSMGVVYRARQVRTGATRALKVLGTCDPELLARFRREAEALARVGGEAVVPIHEIGVAQGKIFFAMGFMPRGSLRARLARGPLDWRTATRLGVALARALDRCHRAGVIHRDLKPDNVLFDEDDRPRLADFGLARDLTARALTDTGTILGTPAYMAPEQLAGKPADARSDLYALGTLLHETVAGVRPFEGVPFAGLMDAKKNDRREPLPRSAPRRLDLAIARAMSATPEWRPQSADELARELTLVLEERPAPRRPARAALLVLAAALAGAVVLRVFRTNPDRSPAEEPAGPATAPAPAAALPAGDPVLAHELLQGAAQALRARQAPGLALERVRHAREASRGGELPAADVAAVISAAFERLARDAKDTNPLDRASTLEMRFQELEATLGIARSLGSKERPAPELADVALAVGNLKKAAGHEWQGVFEAGLLALDANPDLADQLAAWCVEWVRHRPRTPEMAAPFLERFVAAAPAPVRARALRQKVEYLRLARPSDEMLRAALEALAVSSDPGLPDELAEILIGASPPAPLDPGLLGALAGAAPGSADLLAVRGKFDPERHDDLVRALEAGLHRVDRTEALTVLGRDVDRIRARARSLVLARRLLDAAVLLERSPDAALRRLADDAFKATTDGDRAALARALE